MVKKKKRNTAKGLEVREGDGENEGEIDRLGKSTEAVKQTSAATGWN